MFFLCLAAVVLCFGRHLVDAKSVFAHFMVSNTARFTQSDWENDIRLAKAASIDAFALNMADDEDTTRSQLPNAFAAANAVGGFKLFFSFDYAGNGPWDKQVVTDLINQYKSNSAYFYRGSQAFVSTFEGPGNASDWHDIKASTGCFFIPDWSSLGAKDALALGTADGLFSWAAWPTGPRDAHTYDDASYFDFLKGKPYMAPASPWFYTNLPGYKKNWLWRGDDLWFDRWQQLIFGEFQPEYIQIISWNDFGESHYIGPLNDKEYTAFTTGRAPYNYVENMPHDGWRNFLPYHISLWKTGTATVTQEGAVAWYRLSPATACSDGGTTGNTASQLLLEYPPAQIVQDKVFFTALLGSNADVSVTIGGTTLPAQWSTVPDGGVGLYHGSVNTNGLTGAVTVSITRSGNSVVRVDGQSISTSCSGGLNNFNAWVGSNWGNSISAVSPSKNIAQMKCIKGTGANNFQGLCEFTCQYGYCPESACVCTHFGTVKEPPKATGQSCYPLPGASPAYIGLCSFAGNHGYCPSTACGTVDGGTSIPTTSPFLPPTCTGGTGPDNYVGLCDYSCNWGFCPMHLCTCTKTGPLNVPPAITFPAILAAADDGTDDRGLCQFACERSYCPPPCQKSSTTLPGGGFIEEPNGDFSQGLLVIYTDFTVVHADQQLSDLVKRLFGSNTCPPRRRRGLRVSKRDALTDCVVNTATLLAKDAQYVNTVIELLQGNPIAYTIKHMDNLPKWSNEAQAAAFHRSALIGVGLLEQVLQVIDTATQIWFVYVTMNFAIQQIWNHPDNFKNFALGRVGTMKLSCPAVEDVSCSHVLCEGGDNAVCTAFLQGCSCTKSDCPTRDNGKYGLFCQECGGADLFSGRCNGNNGQYKGCACIESVDEPYTVDNAAASEFQTIFMGGDFTPPPPPPPDPDQIICYKQADGVKDDPTRWKFVDRAILDENIFQFCTELGDLSNAAGGSFERPYNPNSLNSVIIRASWVDGYVTTGNCTDQLRALSADCDWHPTENQYNWKWGGEFLKKSMHYYIIPQANRVAIYNGDGDNWWRDGDDRHWRTINQQNPSDDINAPRVGKNGQPYDMIILHQCLHDIRRRNWDHGSPHDCAGLVNFSGSATSVYDSWVDCFDNTWQLNSWGWMHMGVVTMYGEHRGGAAGPSGAHCWQGTDRF